MEFIVRGHVRARQVTTLNRVVCAVAWSDDTPEADSPWRGDYDSVRTAYPGAYGGLDTLAFLRSICPTWTGQQIPAALGVIELCHDRTIWFADDMPGESEDVAHILSYLCTAGTTLLTTGQGWILDGPGRIRKMQRVPRWKEG